MIKKLSIPEQWFEIIKPYLEGFDLETFFQSIEEEYNSNVCYPPLERVFFALNEISPSQVKVVILGQDPYHGPNQANGLAFSVNSGMKIPPSLLNIFKEIKNEYGFEIPSSGDLTPWLKQGVLLLNSTLTVREASANSHQGIGWERITDALVKALANDNEHLVFILWGTFASKKKDLIPAEKHLVLTGHHPSPLSAHKGFFGNNHFLKTNDFLIEKQKTPINWKLSNQFNITFD
ncbi:MAG: uracil-DNA glycosylase [Flavobacteriales bacterium]|jgi:uracil-DNA glycosylase